jgi:hypothetical protein
MHVDGVPRLFLFLADTNFIDAISFSSGGVRKKRTLSVITVNKAPANNESAACTDIQNS